jgi:hypothetical protein
VEAQLGESQLGESQPVESQPVEQQPVEQLLALEPWRLAAQPVVRWLVEPPMRLVSPGFLPTP